MPAIHGILLAAGESRRMGYPKPLLEIEGRTFLEHLSRLMLQAVPGLTIVVGASADKVLRVVPADPRVSVEQNLNYRRGQLSSLKLALERLDDAIDAVLVHLCDHPLVKATTMSQIVAQYQRTARPIVLPVHDGRRGHPLIFARPVFSELVAASDSQGARAVVNRDPARVAQVEVDDPGIHLDIDEPADLARAGLKPPPS